MTKTIRIFLCAFLALLCLPVQIGAASHYDSLFGPEGLPGYWSDVYWHEDSEHRVTAVFPTTENFEVNQKIDEHIRREIDYFKLMVPAGEFVLNYTSRAFDRHLVSFTIETTARDRYGEVLWSRATGLSFDLLGGRRLNLGDILAGGFEADTRTAVMEQAFERGVPIDPQVSATFNTFAFDTDHVYLYFSAPLSSFEAVIPVYGFDHFRGAEFRFIVDGLDDTYLPQAAALPPGLRKVDVRVEPLSEPVERKYIALTFDDGPCRTNTPRILDYLAAHNATATFFVLGNRLPDNGDIMLRAYQEGHAIGNHSYNHLQFTGISESQLQHQILETNYRIEYALGSPVTMLRPPYGTIDARVRQIARDNNMAIVNWDIDPEDWRNFDARRIADHVIERAADGSIVVLHDVHATTAEATAIILETLTERGFTFVRVDELINMHSGLVPGRTYRNGRSVGR